MKNVLVVGSGAREVAVSRKISESKIEHALFCASSEKNPQIESLCSGYLVCPLSHIKNICEYALLKKIDLVFIGPENPLADGIVNELEAVGISCVGPKKEVAMIETSKSFARDIIENCAPEKNPAKRSFKSLSGVESFINELNGEYVIKYDGLMGGKGVKISGEHLPSIKDGLKYAQSLVDMGGSFLVEEKLVGEEFSLMSFVDGKTCCHMPIVQDHKRAFEGDVGPNTGGMGTYSFANHSLPFLKNREVLDAQKTNELVAKQLLKKTGVPFVGVLYGGFMLTQRGVKVIEYNARLGDPEAMNVLCLMKTDFLKVCDQIIGGSLSKNSVEFEELSTVCKYAVPRGYPNKPAKGFVVDCKIEDLDVYLASVKSSDGQVVACGSRTAAAIGKDKNVFVAEKFAERKISSIGGDLFHRKDIGTKELISRRIDRMEKILR
jgi:phosphoribosylamine--glycine ligase